MKKTLLGIIVGLVVGVAATWLALRQMASPDVAKNAVAAAPAEKPKENPLHVNATKRAAAGITLAKPASASLAAEVTGFGRVIDPAPFVALVAELETARAALVASEKDAARVRKLFEAGANASAQALETAEAAAARDRAAVASARARLISGWGRKLANGANLSLTTEALEKDSAFVRIDLLPGDAPAAELKTASVGLLGGGQMVDAEILGTAPAADPQLQGVNFIGVVHGKSLPVGAALRVALAGPGKAETALTVLHTAVVFHQGSPWIYVLGEEDIFERKIVTLGRLMGDRIAIKSGLEESDQVAVTGAGQLLSAELQAGGAPEAP